MRIQQTGFLELLNAQVQYRIPIYQRKYDWTRDECLKLLSDIVDIANDSQRDQHFVGSIIYKSEQAAPTVGAVNVYYLIDGQQRLTTLMLIIWAIGHRAKETVDEETYNSPFYNCNLDALKKDYLTNDSRLEPTDRYYKLQPIGEDNDAYKSLLKDEPLPIMIESSTIYDNYNAILSKIHTDRIDPNTVLLGIKKLVIANISLETRDNPQLIFETVNSTGKPLRAVDKVRNYILMNAGEDIQQHLFSSHWQPMEQRLNINSDKGKTLDAFFRYYASIITESNVPNDYYSLFKDHYLGINPDGISLAVKDMEEYSIIYKRWLDSNESMKGTDLLLYRLKITNNDVYIPVVLKTLRSVGLDVLSASDADEILKYLEAYVIRREMCGLRTAIGEVVVKTLKSTTSLESIKQCLVFDLTAKQKMPTDNDLKIELRTRSFYGLPHDHYILDRIEKYLNPAYMPDHKMVSIEHIMPQTIESSDDLFSRTDYSQQEKEDRDWAKDLGANWNEIHEKYCDTIGNLTLTGYNTNLSNCRFTVKRDMSSVADDGLIYGYSASAIRLSHSLKSLSQWGEQEILARLELILGYISKVWPYPQVDFKSPPSPVNEGSEDTAAKQLVKNELFSSSDFIEIRKNKLYKKTDSSEGYLVLASKMYPRGNEEQYWYGYRDDNFSAIESCSQKFCSIICRRKNELVVLKIPYSLLVNLKPRLHQSSDEEGKAIRYHIHLRRNLNGKYTVLLARPTDERLDVTKYVVKTIPI